mgnify:CR=1 FL=1
MAARRRIWRSQASPEHALEEYKPRFSSLYMSYCFRYHHTQRLPMIVVHVQTSWACLKPECAWGPIAVLHTAPKDASCITAAIVACSPADSPSVLASETASFTSNFGKVPQCKEQHPKAHNPSAGCTVS